MTLRSAPTGSGPHHMGWMPSLDQLALMLVGVITAFGAASYSYSRTPSLWLAGFIFILTSYGIGRGVASTLARPQRLQRAIFFALLPLASVAMFAGIFVLGGPLWLATILGLVVGSLVQGRLGRALFPQIAVEEGMDGRRRWFRPETWGEPREDDLVPPWMQQKDTKE